MDEGDIASKNDIFLEGLEARRIRQAAASIPAGNPGVCEYCDLPSPRLVGGACATCRDKYKLP